MSDKYEYTVNLWLLIIEIYNFIWKSFSKNALHFFSIIKKIQVATY